MDLLTWINIYLGLCIALITGLIFFVINIDREEISIAKGYLIECTNIVKITIYLTALILIRFLDLILSGYHQFFSNIVILIIPIVILTNIFRAYIVIVSIIVSSETRIVLRNKYVLGKFLESKEPSIQETESPM